MGSGSDGTGARIRQMTSGCEAVFLRVGRVAAALKWRQRQRDWRCAEVRSSREGRRAFQLESLILAQNERWRQA